MRSRKIGSLGEQLAAQALVNNGFRNIINLNEVQVNHEYADICAERDGERYAISVKTRNKYCANGKLNSAYNLSGRGEHLALAERAERAHSAKAAWIAVVLEEDTFSAYFGLLSELNGKNQIPMTLVAIKGYECIVAGGAHNVSYADIKNDYETVGMTQQRSGISNIFASAYPNIASWVADFGYIEMGYDDCNQSFVRALDIGGMIWEGERTYASVDEAMLALEAGIKAWMEEQYGQQTP